MKIEINIKNRHVLLILLFIIAASAIGLVVAYGGTTPSAMGHTWGEMYCPGCITNPNLADNSVTGIKIQDGTITGADIQDGSIAKADLAPGTIFDGLGATVPASITCPCHYYDWQGSPIAFTATLVNLGNISIYNNRLTIPYSYSSPCTDSSGRWVMYSYTCARYYFGNGEWSACSETRYDCAIYIG